MNTSRRLGLPVLFGALTTLAGCGGAATGGDATDAAENDARQPVDAAPPTPDATPPTHDAAPPSLDAALSFDAAPPTRDAVAPPPDAVAPTPDAVAPTPDATPPTPDAGAPGQPPHVEHVLMVSIDGLHGPDLERFVAQYPASNLAHLAARGLRFTNTAAPFPSDSFPSMLALFTGGTPRSTGVFYDLSYDRRLSPPGSQCARRGTLVDFSDAVDLDHHALDGGGGLNVAQLPLDPDLGCTPVLPHMYLQVNTAFEVLHAAGLRTAWSDKHLTYEILQGPSGAGIDDLYNPEVSARGVNRTLAAVEAYDDLKIAAILNEIGGLDHAGGPATVPALFGTDLQAVSVTQKLPGAGYLDAAGTPSPDLDGAMQHTDAALGQLVGALRTEGLWDSTLLVVTAAHGQSPMDPARVNIVDPTLIPQLIDTAMPGLLAQATLDDVALLWLNDPAQAEAVSALLMANADAAGIDDVLWGQALVDLYGDAAAQPRTPDLIARVRPGTIYTDPGKKIAEHGGDTEDDRKVALLIAGADGAAGIGRVDDPVETRQVAPTVLQALRLDPASLQAVVSEGTAPLPGLTFGR